MTVDNEFTLYLDGQELGQGAEWRELYVFNLATNLLTPGKHILAVRAFNSFFAAGMLFGLQVTLADGRVIAVKSDTSWRIVPNDAKRWERSTEGVDSWPAATIVGQFLQDPWGMMPENINIMPSVQPVRVLFWQTGWFQITLLTVCGLAILVSLRLMAQLALHRKERRVLLQERTRIAMEIHDQVGANLTKVGLQLNRAGARACANAHLSATRAGRGAKRAGNASIHGRNCLDH